MDFKKYNRIIDNNKYEMLFLHIYYCLKCNDDFKLEYDNLESKNIQEQLEKLIHFIDRAYLKDESHMDLGYLCDKAFEFKNEILLDKMNTWDFLEECSSTL